MGLTELFILAVGLSMDAFAVSICKGLSMRKLSFKNMCIVGLWFGGFQAAMPALGYLLGSAFASVVNAVSHWIAFALLAIIGINMIRESFSEEEDDTDGSLAFKTMLVMAIATSIDALAVGVGFAMLDDVNIIAAVSFIGCVTFILSAAGVKVGNVFGTKYKSRAELSGGIILIALGIKIVLEHFGLWF